MKIFNEWQNHRVRAHGEESGDRVSQAADANDLAEAYNDTLEAGKVKPESTSGRAFFRAPRPNQQE
jgi:hypothetical protein